MTMKDLNSLLDPENLPGMQERGQSVRLHGPGGMDPLDLLTALESDPTVETGEEPPWIAEFLSQYRLVFSGSESSAEARTAPAEPIRLVEFPPVAPQPSPSNPAVAVAEAAAPPRVDEPLRSLDDQEQDLLNVLREQWSWFHSAIAVTLLALSAGLVLMFVAPTRQAKRNAASAPAVAPHLENATATDPASPPTASTDVNPEKVADGVPLHKVLPIYPSAAVAQKLEGNVSLQADIARDGKVKRVTVLSGDPILAQAALVAVRQWTYSPAGADEPDQREQQVTIRFKAP
jgi:TonB family protein